MNRILMLIALLVLAPVSAATTVSADITTNTTWNSAGSPYVLNPAGASGGTITVRNGATLTIDSTTAAVAVQWNEDCDFKIGNGASEQGTLVIKAASGTVTFQIKTGGNVRIANNGQISWSSTTATTTFTRYDGSNTWGALIFEASQTRQSEIKKSSFQYGGNDSREGMIVVEDTADFTPKFNDVSFSNEPAASKAAIRFNGKGINTLREGAITPPFSVSSITYVFYLNAITSTAPTIRFPDIDTPDSPVNYLAGTCTVGDASNVSHWRFDDNHTFKCANSSLVTVTRGSIWGTVESRPEFRSVNASPTFTNWTGLRDNGTTYANIFGEIGPFAFVSVRDASFGVDVDKYAVSSPISGKTMVLPNIKANHCDYGVRLKSATDGILELRDADLGHASSSAEYNSQRCVQVTAGKVTLRNCDLRGVAASGFGTYRVLFAGSGGLMYDLKVLDTRIGGQGQHGVYLADATTSGTATFERCWITGSFTNNSMYLFTTGSAPHSLTVRHCYFGGTAGLVLNEAGISTPTYTVLVEDTTFTDASGTTYGIYAASVPASPSTVTCRRCTFYGRTYGVYIPQAAANLCEYTIEDCYFTGNSYGIRDDRTVSARLVATHCTFQGNTTDGAYDASGGSAATDMLAENCYWGAANGPSGSGPGSGDAVSTNVDYSPFLARPYIGWLIGGSPAGVSALGVNNAAGATNYADQLHIIDDDAIAVKWTFASDFNGSTQSTYEIDIDNDAGFGSLTYNGSETSSSSTDVAITPTLAAGTVYYLRVRLKDGNSRAGPWYYHTFRTNTAPPQVGNTNRTPADDYGAGGAEDYHDATPSFIWERPTDTEEDPLHFELNVDDDAGFGSVNVNLSSVTTPSAFEISTDSGTTWVPFPSTGAQQGATIRIRCTLPTANALADGTWNWRVRATDGFENGSYASTWDFVLTRGYTISGRLSGGTIGGKVVGIAHNGAVLGGVTDTTDGSGDFDLTTTANLALGDALVVFLNDDSAGGDGATVIWFTGESMTAASGLHKKIDLETNHVIIEQRLTQSKPFPHLMDSGIDSDIPWTWQGGSARIQFLSTINGSGNGVFVRGPLGQSTESIDCYTSDVEFTVTETGCVKTAGGSGTSGEALSLHKLANNGTLEISGGDRLLIDGANSTSSGTLRVFSSTLRLKKAGGITFTVDRGTAEFRNATLDVDTGDVSTLEINTASVPAGYAILDCTGSTFSKIKLVVETDGIVAAFNDNIFSAGISTRHIHWKAEDPRTVTTFRGTQFNYSLGGGEFNVEASATALVLSMVRSGGPRYGEGYDKNGGSEGDSLDNKVLWTLMPPLNVATTLGDTRVRITWTADDQADLTNAGYNVYRATSEGGSYSLINGALVTDAFYNDSSLSNGTTYWYYVTCVDTNTSPDTESGGSARVLATPAAASISLLTPSSAPATSILAMTVVGSKTHWDGSATLTMTQGGGSGVTVNDTIVLSATLMLSDATLSSATTGTWTVTATRNDVWSISAYDETDTENFTVNANSNDNRPTISFTNPSADADTSGAFTIGLSYSANSGNAIDTARLELFASRDVTVAASSKSPGTNLSAVASFWDASYPTSTTAVATLNGGGSDVSTDWTGEYTFYARVGNNSGLYSEWVTRRCYIEGANLIVLKTTTLLKQGDKQVNVIVNGSGLSTSQTVSFGSNITVHSVSGTSTQLTINVSVDELAACGPRAFSTNNGTKVGVVVVDWPTNVLPANATAEPSRNPAIGALNVFLHTGEFFKSKTDLAVRGRMAGISWSRFYRSGAASYNGPLGHGWMGFYYQRCVYDAGTGDIFWYTPDLRKETFPDVTGGFSSPVGVYVKATRETTHNTITLTDRHGHRCVFNSNGRLWRCIDRNGNTVECTYNYAGQLTTISNDLGETFSVAYQTHGRVDTVSDNMWNDGSSGHTSVRQVEYEFDSNGDLTEQKAPTTSRYDGSPLPRVSYVYRYIGHRLAECVNPNESAQGGTPASYMENQYEYDSGSGNYRIVAQRLGGQDQWLYTRYVSSTSVRCIDRRGLRTDYTLDASGRATTVRRYTKIWSVDTEEAITHSTVTEVSGKINSNDPDYFDTVLTYNSNHEVLTVTYPRGNKVTYTYALSAASQTSGTATSCSANVLTKTSAGWTPSAYVGMTLRMGTDAGNYRYYAITANTSDTITVDATFSLSGDGWGASAYAVYNLNSDPMAAGNVLTVTRSDEALGALADIVTTYTYEPRYQFVKTVKDPRNNTTTYTYDYEESSSTTDAFGGNLVLVTTPTVTQSMAASSTITSRTTYNEYGQPVSMTDGEGNVTLFKYYTADSHKGFLYQRISAYGSLDITTEFDYDPVGNLTTQWPPQAFAAGVTKDEYKTSYVVNELDQTVKVTGRELLSGQDDRQDVYYYYDANGNLTHTFSEYVTSGGTEPTDPADYTSTTGFAAYKATTGMTATWVESKTTYDLLNRPYERVVDAIAGSTITQYTSRTTYDVNDNAVSSISPLGNKSKRVYDERDMVYQSIAGADSDVAATFTSSYDDNGNIETSTDARGYSSTYTYDGFDRTTQANDPAGHYRTTTYDATSNVLYSRAYNSAGTLLAESLRTYDEINRAWKTEVTAKDADGNNLGDGLSSSTMLLDKNSRLVSSTDDNGVTPYRFYDSANRVDYTRDALGNEVRYTYNLDGAVTKTTFIEVNGLTNAVEKSHTECDLDKLNRCVKFRDQRYASGTFDTEVEYAFDSTGFVTTFTDASGITALGEHDLLGRTTRNIRKPSATESTWVVTDTTFDADSRVNDRTIYETGDDTSPTSPQITSYEYDERSRVITKQRADGDIWTMKYDANGNVTEWLDPLGTRVTNSYDNRNLLTYRNISRGTNVVGATYEAYAYDALARLTSSSNYDGSKLISASQWRYNMLSLPEELTQTVADSDGDILGTYTTGAEYDAAGLLTATLYNSGTRVEHVYDQRNRLLNSFDVTHDTNIAHYLYAGSRLLKRYGGNGVVTEYTYQASGCGCGGFTSFCERIKHSNFETGEELAAVDRRYDVRGFARVERREDFGDLGVVWRQDDSGRHTKTFFGVDLTSSNLTTHVSTDPSTNQYALRRTYNLDTRGNRSGSSGIRDEDDAASPNIVRDTSYTVSTDKMNLYTAAGGNDYEFDAIEQMTRDRSTELYKRYDYRGQLWYEDTDSDIATPERTYTYDTMGRRKTEAALYEASYDLFSTQVFNSFCFGFGTCSDTLGDLSAADYTYDSAGSLDALTENYPGLGVHGSGSSSARHPDAIFPNPGRVPFDQLVAEGVNPNPGAGDPTIWWHHEDMLGSLILTTGGDAEKVDVLQYGTFGEPQRFAVAFHGREDLISSTTEDTPEPDITKIHLNSAVLTNDALIGLLLAVSVPGDANDRLRLGRVVDNDTDDIWVLDDGAYSIASAIYSGGVQNGFTVYKAQDANVAVIVDEDGWRDVFYSEEKEPYGTWLQRAGTTFGPSQVGQWVYLATGGIWVQIMAVEGTDYLILEGDRTADVSPGDPYTIARSPYFQNAPVGTGAWEDAAYDAGDARTELLHTNQVGSAQVGDWVYLATGGIWAQISAVISDDYVAVAGDVTDYVEDGDEYTISESPYFDHSTSGVITGESYSGGTGLTTLTDSQANLMSYMAGWQVILDFEFPVALTIYSVPSATTFTVTGDVTTLVEPGDTFIILPPPGVSQTTGAIDTSPLTAGPRHLWAGYRYQIPMVGFYVDPAGAPTLGTYGAQSGGNKLGQYYAWNRTYDIGTGRWTTPDPVATPFFTLACYAGNAPTQIVDPTGLIPPPAPVKGEGSAEGSAVEGGISIGLQNWITSNSSILGGDTPLMNRFDLTGELALELADTLGVRPKFQISRDGDCYALVVVTAARFLKGGPLDWTIIRTAAGPGQTYHVGTATSDKQMEHGDVRRAINGAETVARQNAQSDIDSSTKAGTVGKMQLESYTVRYNIVNWSLSLPNGKFIFSLKKITLCPCSLSVEDAGETEVDVSGRLFQGTYLETIVTANFKYEYTK